MAAPPKTSHAIMEEAAEWLLRVQAGPLDPGEATALETWTARSPAHALAWTRAQRLSRKLGALSPSAAITALDLPDNPGRRAALAKLALLLAAAPAGWAAWNLGAFDRVRFDHATRIGEIKTVRLADGSRVTLNTDSAIDVTITQHVRRVLLKSGEVYVETAPGQDERPFLVETIAGRLQALGTRFAVRRSADRFSLTVLEGAVAVTPRAAASRVVKAGRQIAFSADGVSAAAPADKRAAGWSTGMFIADATPLRDVVAELNRYSHRRLRVDPAAGDIAVSGAYPLTDVDTALGMLAATYPVAVEQTLLGFVATVSPR